MQSDQLHKIAWQNSIWFSDVDDTIMTTAKSTIPASEGIRDVITARFGERIGKATQEEFLHIFKTMLHAHRGNEASEEYESLVQEIEHYQRNLPSEYGLPKKWSREIFVAIAARRLGLTFSSELISEAVDSYWMQLTQKASIISGVLELITKVKKQKRPFYLVTGSDVRLKQKEDGQFLYNPVYSENFKRERVAILRERGISFNLVSIGDPEDKPHKDFFEKAVRMAEEDMGKKIDLSNAIIIGDSFAADLQTPKEQMGFGLAVLYQDGKKEAEVIDEHQIITGNLEEIVSYISE